VPPLEFLDDAIEEAEAAARWYADRSPLAATGFADEIVAAVEAIQRTPDAWPAYDHGTRRFLLRRYPYFIVYSVEPSSIVVIAVAHAHRRPGYWRVRIEAPG
jgi:plasmid stabilization system protein ParE